MDNLIENQEPGVGLTLPLSEAELVPLSPDLYRRVTLRDVDPSLTQEQLIAESDHLTGLRPFNAYVKEFGVVYPPGVFGNKVPRKNYDPQIAIVFLNLPENWLEKLKDPVSYPQVKKSWETVQQVRKQLPLFIEESDK
ncbi:hypothetical protein A2955_03600 [Candidatus Woesebacteria bacterium RIFCSPLOWO2_01_FULL_37_19]|uniref:Uncharacterized protein n=2 Tax=Candidatus Woeseibacteriota TaxID=1752722 RepID=A0A1F8B799_9BACT|nr:MAG: hypothetical protein A2771_02595 [Candidatus Woesebacteria bacterium RIFCSPHIGHO2_01_FULL_38_26b]OGM59810.1 MAG: hypothetical protein A2955_03600 [Candidatus Woesebacteria bacterium RIFCSPLOWO2_01_FULL_37_19]